MPKMKNILCIEKPMVSQNILTTLKIKNYLLIGVGNSLKIFDLKDKKREISVHVFAAANIHEIKEWPKKETNNVALAIFGQKSFSVIQIYEDTLSFKTIVPEQQLEDWIINGTIGNDESILMLTAHNKCLKLNLLPLGNKKDDQTDLKNSGYQITTTVLGECRENSLLYSGLIGNTCHDYFIFMGGTAFGNIVLWSASTPSKENEKRSPLHILTSPKGTIFSLSFNNELMLISSTSDDRSVRLWKVTCKKTCDDQQSFWENSEINQIFCSYGHSARVWRSNILSDQTVLTCGEDSLVCHWSYSGSLISSWKAHPGTSVWCISSSENIVYTGGGDGALKMWSLRNKDANSRIEFPLSINDMKKCKVDLKNLQVKDFPRSINLINSSSAVIVSNSGHLLMWKNCNKNWTLLYDNLLLQGYIMTSMNKCSSLIALGTLSGLVIIYNIESYKLACKTRISSVKIQSLIFVDDVLLTCSSGIIQLWTLENDDVNGFLQLMQEHHLPFCRQQWVTAFTFCEVSSSKGEDFIVAGDPSGNVHLYFSKIKEPIYTLKSLHGSQGVSSINKSKHFIITSGRDGHIRFLNIEKDELVIVYDMKIKFGSWICGIIQWKHHLIAPIFNGAKLQFWNLSQDQLLCDIDCGGGHRAWDILINEKRFLSSGKLQDFNVNENSSHLVYSFLKDGIPSIYTSSFEQRLLSEILIPISGREIQSLISLWTYNNKSIVTFGGDDTLLYVQFVMKNKLHKINTIKSHLSSIRTIIKIENYSYMFRQDLNLNQCDSEIFILSCGGRAQIKVWKYSLTELGKESVYDKFCINLNKETSFTKDEIGLGTNFKNVGNVENETVTSEFKDEYFSSLLDPIMLCQEVGSHMLKIEKQNHWKSTDLTFDPETRYMDSIAFWASANIALFILASSDGLLRIFKYEMGKEFELLHSEDCLFCLLRLNLIKLQQSLLLIASTTRGKLIFWDIQKFANHLIYEKFSESHTVTFKQISSFQVCSSGINSLSVKPTDSLFKYDNDGSGCETICLAAGCDSGEIFLVEINVVSQELDAQFSITSSCGKILFSSISHAAQVSGLAWIASDLLCSISIDQRLIVWQFEMAFASIKLSPIEVAFSSVPDIQGLHLVPKIEGDIKSSRRIYVYGSGLQIFDIDVGAKD